MNFDPSELGWQEFLLRITGVSVVGITLLLIAVILIKSVLGVVKFFRRVADLFHGKEEDMTEESLRWALLKLVPQRKRSLAARLIQNMIDYNRGGHHALAENVYVSEYDGKPSRVHVSSEAAQEACEAHLKDDMWPSGRWDWVPDEYGLVMRRTDPVSGRPGAALSGRITRTRIER